MRLLRTVIHERDRIVPYLEWKLRRVIWPAYLGARFHCPVCGGRFRRWAGSRTSPSRPVVHVRCPRCDALPRMRSFWGYLRAELEPEHRILHVSPEVGFERRLRPAFPSYVTLDLNRADVDVRASLTELPFEEARFDRIICSDVLEHIEDDRTAMRELRRTLAPDGVAIVRVPIRGETTLEDPGVTDPAERDRLFGQPDHVRFYGLDIADRLRDAGFEVEPLVLPRDLGLSAEETAEQGLGRDETYFLCR